MNVFGGLISRLDIAKERINEIKNGLIQPRGVRWGGRWEGGKICTPMERADRMWSTGEGNDKPLQYSCLENPMKSMKRQNDRILKEEVGAQYATGDQWINNSRNNEGMESKQKQYPVVDATGDRSKV